MNKRIALIGIVIVAVVIIGGGIVAFTLSGDDGLMDKAKETQNTSKVSITEQKKLDEKTVQDIKSLYNKVASYGTSNIVKVLYEKRESNYSIKIAYSDSSRNGMYITVSSVYATKVKYGDEKNTSSFGSVTKTERDYEEYYFSNFKDSSGNTFLTGDEFRQLISE